KALKRRDVGPPGPHRAADNSLASSPVLSARANPFGSTTWQLLGQSECPQTTQGAASSPRERASTFPPRSIPSSRFMLTSEPRQMRCQQQKPWLLARVPPLTCCSPGTRCRFRNLALTHFPALAPI